METIRNNNREMNLTIEYNSETGEAIINGKKLVPAHLAEDRQVIMLALARTNDLLELRDKEIEELNSQIDPLKVRPAIRPGIPPIVEARKIAEKYIAEAKNMRVGTAHSSLVIHDVSPELLPKK